MFSPLGQGSLHENQVKKHGSVGVSPQKNDAICTGAQDVSASESPIESKSKSIDFPVRHGVKVHTSQKLVMSTCCL